MKLTITITITALILYI